MNALIETKLREVLDGTTTTHVDFATIAPLLREAVVTIMEQRLMILSMDHCVQSTWKRVPAEIVERFAHDEAIPTANRLPSAVAFLATNR